MLKLGETLAKKTQAGDVIYLRSELGAGKTTLTRGLLRYLGYQGTVKSPTYTIVESYTLKHFQCFHFDLYRLRSPKELEYIGLEDYFIRDAVCLIEWPEKAKALLPKPTIDCSITIIGRIREVEIIFRKYNADASL